MDKETFDQLKFAEPSDSHIAKMSLDTPLIDVSADQINLNPPPSNSSDETFSEIRSILKAVAGSKDDSYYIDVADKKPIQIFQSFANKKNLKFDDQYFTQLKKDLKPIILNLKYRFNRPRPRQLIDKMGIDLNGLDIVNFNSSNTPSYPSGHTIQAHVISNVLSEMNPGLERSLESLADRISYSRLQAGVHYLSDIVMGKEIANMIDRYIKKPHSKKGLALENDFRKITRDFLRESIEEDVPRKLRVLDFDDTIADTAERVVITTNGGRSHKYISSADFAVYDLQPGESIDPEIAFREFNRVDAEKATPVPLISDMLRSFASAPGNRKLLILTARSQDVADDVMNFLESSLGISNPSDKIDFIGVASKDPLDKVREIESILDRNPTIDFVSFYDDSGKNVRAVHDFLDRRGFSRDRDQRDVRQVIKDEEGNIRLINPLDQEEEISESIDLRKLTRRFLMML